VTGGIAAGKSTVVGVLRGLGAVVVDADALAREVLAPGAPAVAEVAEAFGPGLVTAAGAVDRAGLGRLVFADPAARARLEAITHPRIQALSRTRFEAAPANSVVVHDIPLLVELDLTDQYHLVVVVDAPAEERVRRLVVERGMTEDDAWVRVRAQASDAQRRAAADVWLDNPGAPEDLAARATRLWHDRLIPFEANLRFGRPAPRTGRPVIVDHDPGWAAAGSRLVARVRRALGGTVTSVEHVGSTAVPGLAAQDVLEVQVVTADLDTAQSVAGQLVDVGLVPAPGQWRDTPATVPGRWQKAVAVNADPDRAVDCHIRPAGSPAVGEVLGFRDVLRADAALRERYAELKHRLAQRTRASVDDYATAKTEFIAEALRAAGPPRPPVGDPGPAGQDVPT
jgi:dephospho-CoA kinase